MSAAGTPRIPYGIIACGDAVGKVEEPDVIG
jgi:hypothetical protein